MLSVGQTDEHIDRIYGWRNFEIYMPRMVKIGLDFFTMVGENFECYLSQIARIAFKLSKKAEEILLFKKYY